jgi:hypothetical protein
MGYTPGSFFDERGDEYHFELKGGNRVVLWNADESKKILSLSADNVDLMLSQLSCLWGIP